jgi:hypothetical protein
MLQIRITLSDVDHRWSVSLLDQENVVWSSPETFDSPDIAYYRAIEEYVLQKWEGGKPDLPRDRVVHKPVLVPEPEECQAQPARPTAQSEFNG